MQAVSYPCRPFAVAGSSAENSSTKMRSLPEGNVPRVEGRCTAGVGEHFPAGERSAIGNLNEGTTGGSNEREEEEGWWAN